MGVNRSQQFSLHTSSKRRVRNIITFAYLAWAAIFVFIGLQPYSTDAMSGDSLTIPSIHLDTTTEPVTLSDHKFTVPDTNVGSYYANDNKVFLMGHKATIFSNLIDLKQGDEISFAGESYIVTAISIEEKDSIDMSSLLAPAIHPTLILMTCHGTPISATDYSHRLIVTAVHL